MAGGIEEQKERRRTVMGRTKLIALLEEQHVCQWCLENLISPRYSSSPVPSPSSSSLSNQRQTGRAGRKRKNKARTETQKTNGLPLMNFGLLIGNHTMPPFSCSQSDFVVFQLVLKGDRYDPVRLFTPEKFPQQINSINKSERNSTSRPWKWSDLVIKVACEVF